MTSLYIWSICGKGWIGHGQRKRILETAAEPHTHALFLRSYRIIADQLFALGGSLKPWGYHVYFVP
jgi:hypothetical protein